MRKLKNTISTPLQPGLCGWHNIWYLMCLYTSGKQKERTPAKDPPCWCGSCRYGMSLEPAALDVASKSPQGSWDGLVLEPAARAAASHFPSWGMAAAPLAGQFCSIAPASYSQRYALEPAPPAHPTSSWASNPICYKIDRCLQNGWPSCLISVEWLLLPAATPRLFKRKTKYSKHTVLAPFLAPRTFSVNTCWLWIWNWGWPSPWWRRLLFLSTMRSQWCEEGISLFPST